MKKIIVPSNSFLAIADRELRAIGLKPVYLWNRYFDTVGRKKKAGILLHSVEGCAIPFDEKYKVHLGILGFVNGQEPGEGSIAFHEIIPKVGDKIALAYIIQGVYRGNFCESEIINGKALKDNKELQGLHLIHHYVLEEKDIQEKPYEIRLIEDMELKE